MVRHCLNQCDIPAIVKNLYYTNENFEDGNRILAYGQFSHPKKLFKEEKETLPALQFIDV